MPCHSGTPKPTFLLTIESEIVDSVASGVYLLPSAQYTKINPAITKITGTTVTGPSQRSITYWNEL